MTDGSIGLLGNVLKNSDDVVVTVICDYYQERIDAAAKKKCPPRNHLLYC